MTVWSPARAGIGNATSASSAIPAASLWEQKFDVTEDGGDTGSDLETHSSVSQ
jgi:hypothetical protein